MVYMGALPRMTENSGYFRVSSTLRPFGLTLFTLNPKPYHYGLLDPKISY